MKDKPTTWLDVKQAVHFLKETLDRVERLLRADPIRDFEKQLDEFFAGKPAKKPFARHE